MCDQDSTDRFAHQMEAAPSVSERLRERENKRQEIPFKLLTAFTLVLFAGTSAGIAAATGYAIRGSDWTALIGHFRGGIIGALVASTIVVGIQLQTARFRYLMGNLTLSELTAIGDPKSILFRTHLAISSAAAAAIATTDGIPVFKPDFDWMIFCLAFTSALSSSWFAKVIGLVRL